MGIWQTVKKMKTNLNDLIDDEFKQAVNERLNAQKMLMNPRTGTVQCLELWLSENDTENPESFDMQELFEVKLHDEQWVRVN